MAISLNQRNAPWDFLFEQTKVNNSKYQYAYMYVDGEKKSKKSYVLYFNNKNEEYKVVYGDEDNFQKLKEGFNSCVMNTVEDSSDFTWKKLCIIEINKQHLRYLKELVEEINKK